MCERERNLPRLEIPKLAYVEMVCLLPSLHMTRWMASLAETSTLNSLKSRPVTCSTFAWHSVNWNLYWPSAPFFRMNRVDNCKSLADALTFLSVVPTLIFPSKLTSLRLTELKTLWSELRSSILISPVPPFESRPLVRPRTRPLGRACSNGGMLPLLMEDRFL